jgi:hypothetical protein
MNLSLNVEALDELLSEWVRRVAMRAVIELVDHGRQTLRCSKCGSTEDADVIEAVDLCA